MPPISTYFSLSYFLLLFSAIGVYAVTPKKLRRWVILVFSYLFFFAASGKLLIYLLLSTFSVHHIGLWLQSVQDDTALKLKTAEKDDKKLIKARSQKNQQLIMVFAAVLHIGVLAILKYSPFTIANINSVLHFAGVSFTIEAPKILVPIGISFYTLQAISYLFDVYRKKIPADKNLLRLALFMSFFPQIMEGPICRYSNTAESLWNADRIHFKNLVFGLQRILFGIMKKLVVADRLNLFIKNVFNDYENYDGFIIALSAVLYTLQLYMDFSGAMDVVLGSAEIFGITLPENFQRPFFSKSISEFWKRWHITLGTWFKDYIFFPVSMSKPMKKLTSKARKKLGNHYGPLISGSIALFCVWICNGIWHGAGWNYIFFGMYHFILILSGSLIEPAVIKITQKLNINRGSFVYRIMQIFRTCILVFIGELFFRANGLIAGLNMFKKIFTDFSFSTIRNGSILSMGMDKKDFIIIAASAVIIFIIGFLQEKGIHIRNEISKKNIIIRFAIYYMLILYIIVFGAYGAGYVPLDPIYANF